MIFDSDTFVTEYSEKEYFTIGRGYIKLLRRIREQAVQDGALEEWEAYWLNTSPWPHIWKELMASVRRRGEGVGYGKENTAESEESW